MYENLLLEFNFLPIPSIESQLCIIAHEDERGERGGRKEGAVVLDFVGVK